ncbi:glycosyltransferase family 28 protein [Perkinsela sp. CCAP 1560/4]|nr:glycosyltransferase family 28 protein [Perkinsela sp. CCAP 1560/4]|eukprot:KNH06327.1 glycosyltransferase family 28 protein [Perkinsela sp. CCAP 1560/4]
MATIVVLGSGGHTSEMIKVMSHLKTNESGKSQFFYFAATNDITSLSCIQRIEPTVDEEEIRRCQPYSFHSVWLVIIELTKRLPNRFSRGRKHLHIPRFFRVSKVRRVGQSIFGCLIPGIFAFLYSIVLLLYIRPKTILANGPALCIPILWAAAFLRLFGVQSTKLIYIESLTCVDRLSLSGKLVYRIADVFLVHWDTLVRAHPQAIPVRHLNEKPLPPHRLHVEVSYAVVIVGTTKFEGLVRMCDEEWFISSLQRNFGIGKVVCQIGSGEYTPTRSNFLRWYDSATSRLLRDAALVISHGGVGTILDAVENGIPTIAVPNESLSHNHQLSFCRELHRRKCVYSIQLEAFRETFSSLSWDDLRLKQFQFPAAEICQNIVPCMNT